DLQAARQGFREALLLGAHDALDLNRVLLQLRVRIAHLLDDHRREPVEVREPYAVRVLDRATQQAATDVAAAFVRRDNGLGDQEAHGARDVGDDVMRLPPNRAVAVADARFALAPDQDLAERLGLVL